MSRFFISLKKAPIVRIEFSEDVADMVKPKLTELFGMAFLAAEVRENGLYKYKFRADDADVEVMVARLLEFYNTKVVKSIDIDLNMN